MKEKKEMENFEMLSGISLFLFDMYIMVAVNLKGWLIYWSW